MKRKPRGRLNLKLVGLSVDEARQKVEEKIKKRVEDILWQTGPHEVSEADRQEFLRFLASETDDWIRVLYGTCRRVWSKQAGKRTSAFVKQTYEKVINPALENALDSVNRAFGIVRSPWTAGLRPVSSVEWSPFKSGLEAKWHRKLQLERMELESAERQPSKDLPRIKIRWAEDYLVLCDELETLKNEISDESDHLAARSAHPDFETFKIIESSPKAKKELMSVFEERRGFKKLASVLAGVKHKRAPETIRIAVKKYKRILRTQSQRTT